MKVVLWIVVGLVALFFIVLAFAFAKTAKRADEQTERMFREYDGKAQKVNHERDRTCDGCIHLPQKYNGSLVCENCSRGTILPDRYEQKGEQNADARG